MKKPDTLEQFIEELNGEAVSSTAETTKDSKLMIYLDEEAADEEDAITLNQREAGMVLANPAMIERFYEALGSPADASIVLNEVSLPGHSLDALEKHFVAVDEL